MNFDFSNYLKGNYQVFADLTYRQSTLNEFKGIFAQLNKDVFILTENEFDEYHEIQPFDSNHEFVFVIPRYELIMDDIDGIESKMGTYQYLQLHPEHAHNSSNYWSSKYHGHTMRFWPVNDILKGRSIKPEHVIKDLRGIEIAFYDEKYNVFFFLSTADSFYVQGQIKPFFFYIVQHAEIILAGLNKPATDKKARITLAELNKIRSAVSNYIYFIDNTNKYMRHELKRKANLIAKDIQSLQNSIYVKSDEMNQLVTWSDKIEEKLKSPDIVKAMKRDEVAFRNLMLSKRYENILFDGTTVVGQTGMVKILNKYEIGKFTVRMGLDGNLWFNNDTRSMILEEIYHHPHILNNVPCLGNMKQALPNMIKDFQLASALDVVYTYLSTYHRENPYRKLSKWFAQAFPKDYCNNCGEMKEWCKCVQQCHACGNNALSCGCYTCPAGIAGLNNQAGCGTICAGCQYRGIHPRYNNIYTCNFVVGEHPIPEIIIPVEEDILVTIE